MCQCKKEFNENNAMVENYKGADYDKALFQIIDNYLNIELYINNTVVSEIEVPIEFCPFCGQQKF